MRTPGALPAPNPAAYRPSPAVVHRVHGLRRHQRESAAIEARSGDYFFVDDTMDTLQLAHRNHPDAVFYTVHVVQYAVITNPEPNSRRVTAHPSPSTARRYRFCHAHLTDPPPPSKRRIASGEPVA